MSVRQQLVQRAGERGADHGGGCHRVGGDSGECSDPSGELGPTPSADGPAGRGR